ncbi:hypothetical protein J416_06772 [Gracilibacillus halophilus YIM-C55.5]|uniref:Tetraprenyl-beta-curcumene synthase n=1 Tax=Gracilibacillus halophilus YIM-C55.5 TaxID=1308866 RepID=N4WLV4_9BACI|nr:tetraprenyl-beta-curcumene synthase family protein [Gracilibacillus halophilus]ENH97132.1 hypothetical protein J416_06772 [Gracilibacillus halophilus YIM-C55.5]
MVTNKVPTKAPILMKQVYQKIFPQVNKELRYWRARAEGIPNLELRTQALASIESKKFHCQGGSVYSLLAGEDWKRAVRFIVAYQTISDYLDNLCDRSTSMDPTDFRMLHQSMEDALTLSNSIQDYYVYRDDREDANYLVDLVNTCREVLQEVDSLHVIHPYIIKLEQLYSDLQVHKHVIHEERIPRLENWFATYQSQWPMLSWYEFSACTGSTLGIFCMVSYGLGGSIDHHLTERIYQSYFPYLQGLHIMLDYFIDQQEDWEEGDLNFCNYYQDEQELENRLKYFIEQTNHQVQGLPDQSFHEMIQHGLVGLYLADPKVRKLEAGDRTAKTLIKTSGFRSQFFHWNIKLYNRLAGKS